MSCACLSRASRLLFGLKSERIIERFVFAVLISGVNQSLQATDWFIENLLVWKEITGSDFGKAAEGRITVLSPYSSRLSYWFVSKASAGILCEIPRLVANPPVGSRGAAAPLTVAVQQSILLELLLIIDGRTHCYWKYC
jgi:hypothetical protein